MPATTTVGGSLLKKLGKDFDNSLRQGADKPVRNPFDKLPGGITNGIAKLNEIGLAEYGEDTPVKMANGQSAKGQVYFFARGVVCYPEAVKTKDGVEHIKDRTTGIMVSLFDTKSQKGRVTTKSEHVDQMLDHMKLLGGPEFCNGICAENLEEYFQTLLTLGEDGGGPYFRFTTEFGKPKLGPDGKPTDEPLPVFEKWHGTKGVPAGWKPDDSNYQVDASQEEVAPARAAAPTTNGAKTSFSKGTTTAKATAPKAGPKPAFTDMGDLDSLAKQAGDKDPKKNKPARLKLQDFAKDAGLSEEEITDAPDWDSLVSLIKGKAPTNGDGKSAEGEEIELFTPEKGKTCTYLPRDKNDEPTGEEILCEVLKVNNKLETADLKNLEDGETVYEKVDWNNLGPA